MITKKLSETELLDAMPEDGNILLEQNGYAKRVPSGYVKKALENLSSESAKKITSPKVAKVGQMLVVKEVDENGKPIAWESVDRTHWVDGENVHKLDVMFLHDSIPHCIDRGVVDILPETSVVLDGGEGGIEKPITLVAGEIYTVKWNGIEYECVAQDASMLVPGAVCLGNGEIFGLSGNGEPFIVASVPNQGIAVIELTGEISEAAVAIRGSVAEIRKLDNRCLDLEWLPKKNETDLLSEDVYSVTSQSPDGYYFANIADVVDVEVGQKVVVYYDDARYETTLLGNDEIKVAILSAEDENLRINFYSMRTVIMNSAPGEYKVKVCDVEPNKMPEEYLPESLMETIAQLQTEIEALKAKA